MLMERHELPNTDVIFKVRLAIIVSVLHAVVKQAGKEEAWLITLTGVVIVLSMAGFVADLFQAVKSTLAFHEGCSRWTYSRYDLE